MAKFGKKNHVNLDPLAYNICLLGESKVGKTTLIKEMCEKLAGEDGYMFLECGMERGADAIEGINYINCPEWNMDYDELTNSAGFADVCEDIIENKAADYPDLRVVIWDTYDHLISIAEEEAVRLWNKDCRDSGHPEKCVKTINAAWGGYGRGEKKAMELMFNMMGELRKVGVSTIVIGHVKTKDVSDVVSGESYQILTSDQQQNYFNALKKNLHFLGLAYIDRELMKEKNGKSSVMKVSAETRKIKLRDDSYAVDSGSRFANIVPEVEMDADALIKAMNDAILSEQGKSGMSLEETKEVQKKAAKKEAERIAKREEENRPAKELKSIISEIAEFVTENLNAGNKEALNVVMSACKEHGYANPKEIDDLEVAKKILALTLK